MIDVEQAGINDIEELCDMWFELQTYHRGKAAYMKERREWRDNKDRELGLVVQSNNTIIYIAGIDGKAAGYVRGCVRDMSPVYENPRIGNLEELYIREGYRRVGVGRRLVESIKEWFKSRGTSRIVINVSHDNPEARRFWTQMGFDVQAIRMNMDI